MSTASNAPAAWRAFLTLALTLMVHGTPWNGRLLRSSPRRSAASAASASASASANLSHTTALRYGLIALMRAM